MRSTSKTGQSERDLVEEPNIKGDRLNIVLLSYLHVLQALPRGLIVAIPLILQNRNATYTDQAAFNVVTYPICFKLIWAPVVDCVYSKTIGRRKTWILPIQYLIGILLLLISRNVDDWLGSEDGTREPRLRPLIVVFFVVIFLAATQDIALHGWSLSLLQKRNVGYSAMSNGIGLALGNFLGFVFFIVLDSKEFANAFRTVPQDRGFITFSDFLFLWFVVYTVSTTLLWIFKKDNSHEDDDEIECRLGFFESYTRLWQIKTQPNQEKRNLPSFVEDLFFLIMAFGAINGVARLKLMDVGVPRDKFALLTVPSIPFIVLLPFFFGRYLTGRRSMSTFLIIYAFKSMLGVLYAAFIYYTPYIESENHQMLPPWYYVLLLIIYNLDHMADFTKVMAIGAFNFRHSDSRFGGIYMTIFSTMGHLGEEWPISVCLWLVDVLTVRSCTKSGAQRTQTCSVIIDGFYIEIASCTLIGILWLWWGKKQIHKLENLDASAWLIEHKPEAC